MAAPFASRPPSNGNGPPPPGRFNTFSQQQQRMPPFGGGDRGRGGMDHRRGPSNNNSYGRPFHGNNNNNNNGFRNSHHKPPGSFRSSNPNTFRNNGNPNPNNMMNQHRDNWNCSVSSNGFHNNHDRSSHDHGPPASTGFRGDLQRREEQQRSRWDPARNSNTAAPALQESFSAESHATTGSRRSADRDGGIVKSCSSSLDSSNSTSYNGVSRRSHSLERPGQEVPPVEHASTVSMISISSNDESHCHPKLTVSVPRVVVGGIMQQGILGRGENAAAVPPSSPKLSITGSKTQQTIVNEVITDKVPRRTKTPEVRNNDDVPTLDDAIPRRKPKSTDPDREMQVKTGKKEHTEDRRVSTGSKHDRRSSSGSVNSDRSSNKASVSNAGNQSPGGFRRLKKFSKSPPSSPSCVKSVQKSPPPKSPSISKTAAAVNSDDRLPSSPSISRKSSSKSPRKSIVAESDGLTITESLQQAQLKLWEQAREREMKLKGIQEEKRSRQEEKQRRREERKRQRKLLRQQQREEAAQEKGTDADDEQDRTGVAGEEESRTVSAGDPSNDDRRRDRSGRFEKKANRRRSLDNAFVNKYAQDILLPADKSEKKKKSKKNRRLVKLGSREDDEDAGNAFDASNMNGEVSWGLGLADTVKTRVRSCNKNKDSASPDESPAVKKVKKKKRKMSGDLDDDRERVSGEKRKKKKKKSSLEPHNDQAVGSGSITMPKKKKKVSPTSPPHAHPLYDDGLQCSGGVAPVFVKRKRGRPLKKKHVVTEAVPSSVGVDHRPFKKRMSAAAAVTGNWQQPSTMPSCMSTAPAHLVAGACATTYGNAALSHVPSFGQSTGPGHAVVGPLPSMDSDSDSGSSSDDSGSDTDEEELFNWANKMFGTSAVPTLKTSDENPVCSDVAASSTTGPVARQVCDMDRRRQQQEEARALTAKEVMAILQEEEDSQAAGGFSNSWVRRSMRQPSKNLLNNTNVKSVLAKLRGNDTDMIVLKLKKYLSDSDTPMILIDATLEALEECTICESLYIQNYNQGMRDKQVLHLLKILQMPSCSIWCLNIGETYNVTDETWQIFADGLKDTKITHMYASEHTITAELKDQIRNTIRQNRSKHNMHNDPNNLDTIVKCTHCWWNPINAKSLRPYLRKHGYESLLYDREAQGLRGSMSEAPVV